MSRPRPQQQHHDSQKVGRHTTCFRFLRPIYQKIKDEAIATGKSQSMIIHEKVEAGFKATTEEATGK